MSTTLDIRRPSPYVAELWLNRSVDAALRDETARRIADIRASGERRDGMQAWPGKREPAWHKT